ncbi:ATP-binding protein [Ktedonosporobacter rubrisoli]|uniref:Iron-sulfur cluster carrier protein n=1 Tax=Ktedonosporobacter rubrisoli TaxID=2509675 RepID=A0A4P6K3C1_KTERU|nr:Mrp/NBP35 family ATP-binding protein [Ktedonosporobacter rubrisoli]QBD82403.1 ATP-binding protein [Ktedonosporobacter rubrisoli]
MVEHTQRARLDYVNTVFVVGSGKGGVGKSTVSVNLAVALAQRGASVGLLDGDAYGPSIPLMLGVRKRAASQGTGAVLPLAERKEIAPEKKLQPLLRYGVKVMSVGFFIGEEQAVAPMPDVLGLLIRQLLYSVNWGELDYLIIDLPPGTSEPQATLCREVQLDGAVLVTTPQDIARIDTSKALTMFKNGNVPVLGVIQNMDGFMCPHCGERVEIFPQSREARVQLDDLPLLGRIPLDPSAAAYSDKGYPAVVSMPESPVAQALVDAAEQVAASAARLKRVSAADEKEKGDTEEKAQTEDERED